MRGLRFFTHSQIWCEHSLSPDGTTLNTGTIILMPLETLKALLMCKWRAVIRISIRILQKSLWIRKNSGTLEKWYTVFEPWPSSASESSWQQDAALSGQWLMCRTNHKDKTVREQRTACHEKSWLVLLTQWYREWIWSLMSSVCCSTAGTERLHHGKSPPAQPQSASKTNYIHIHALCDKTNGKQKTFRLKPREGCRESAFRIIISCGALNVFTRGNIMSLRGTWHPALSAGRDRASKAKPYQKNTHCARGLNASPPLTSFPLSLFPKKCEMIYIYFIHVTDLASLR